MLFPGWKFQLDIFPAHKRRASPSGRLHEQGRILFARDTFMTDSKPAQTITPREARETR
jgi:hypothetical protein